MPIDKHTIIYHKGKMLRLANTVKAFLASDPESAFSFAEIAQGVNMSNDLSTQEEHFLLLTLQYLWQEQGGIRKIYCTDNDQIYYQLRSF